VLFTISAPTGQPIGLALLSLEQSFRYAQQRESLLLGIGSSPRPGQSLFFLVFFRLLLGQGLQRVQFDQIPWLKMLIESLEAALEITSACLIQGDGSVDKHGVLLADLGKWRTSAFVIANFDAHAHQEIRKGRVIPASFDHFPRPVSGIKCVLRVAMIHLAFGELGKSLRLQKRPFHLAQ
jgi:hypothetical protein